MNNFFPFNFLNCFRFMFLLTGLVKKKILRWALKVTASLLWVSPWKILNCVDLNVPESTCGKDLSGHWSQDKNRNLLKVNLDSVDQNIDIDICVRCSNDLSLTASRFLIKTFTPCPKLRCKESLDEYLLVRMAVALSGMADGAPGNTLRFGEFWLQTSYCTWTLLFYLDAKGLS